MKQLVLIGSMCVCLAGAAVPVMVSAQNQIYRCGNEYTNNPVNAQQRGCRLIGGGSLTIVSTAAPASGAATVAPSSARPAAGATPAAPRVSGARSSAEQVSRAEQRARDSDARQILQNELRRAQERLAQLQLEFNQGQPTPLAGERGQPERLAQRTADLKLRIDRADSDVAAIERELGRLVPATASGSR